MPRTLKGWIALHDPEYIIDGGLQLSSWWAEHDMYIKITVYTIITVNWTRWPGGLNLSEVGSLRVFDHDHFQLCGAWWGYSDRW